MKKGMLLFLCAFFSIGAFAAKAKTKANETVLVPQFDFQPKILEIRIKKENVVNNNAIGKFTIINKSPEAASLIVEFMPTNFNINGGGVNMKLTKSKKEDPRWSLVPYIVATKEPITLKPKESKEYSFVIQNVDKIIGTKFAHFKVTEVPLVKNNYVELNQKNFKKAATGFKLFIQGVVIFEVKDSGKTAVSVNAKYSTKYKKIMFSIKNIGDHYLPHSNVVAFLTDSNNKIIEKIKVSSLNSLAIVKDSTKYFVTERLEKLYKKGKNKIIVQLYADNGNISQSFIMDDLELVTEFNIK